MKQISLLISRYLVTAIIPYFAFAWLLMTVVLFVQQASRYSDIFFSVHIPANLVWQLTIALLPNVIAFTCPMAILVGTIIGLTKMQGDSELVAIRAAGVGNLQIALPILVLGVLLSILAFVVNLRGVPLAASLVRNVALQTAIKKLESPIEPGVFNTEVAGYTIYVKDGDVATGRWRNIFIYNEDRSAANMRLITSREGRIDTTGQNSELVLEDAIVTTLPTAPGVGKSVSENIGEVRLAIRTSRSELIEKLGRSGVTPEEMGLQQLTDYAAAAEGKQQTEAQLLAQRRLLLSITPFIFCVLGVAVVLRFNRGGRGFGILLGLAILIGFYLLAFLGEQLARTGAISVPVAGLMPIAGSALLLLWFSMSPRLEAWTGLADRSVRALAKLRPPKSKMHLSDLFVDVTTGLRDFDIILNLTKNFLLTVLFLSSIFIIFTAFDLWKFAGTIDGGVRLLGEYLFFLVPSIYLQVAPSAAMIAVLATYVIKSRQNEIVTWVSAGQSVYRLLLPSFLLAALLGGMNWIIQERVLPASNPYQDAIRNQIRNQGIPTNISGKQWVANDRRIYSFTLASDNEKGDAQIKVNDLTIYEFSDNGGTVQTVYHAESAVWEAGHLTLSGAVEQDEIADGNITHSTLPAAEIAEPIDPLTEIRLKPSHVNSATLRRQMAAAESDLERRNIAVALQQKYATLFLPLAIALFTAPFSLSLSRKGKAWTVGYAVGLWLLFTGMSSIFAQLGLNGYLSPALAVWSPPAIFAFLGVYLLTRVRT
jgi:LPS export ABC transporter permease LptG